MIDKQRFAEAIDRNTVVFDINADPCQLTDSLLRKMYDYYLEIFNIKIVKYIADFNSTCSKSMSFNVYSMFCVNVEYNLKNELTLEYHRHAGSFPSRKMYIVVGVGENGEYCLGSY